MYKVTILKVKKKISTKNKDFSVMELAQKNRRGEVNCIVINSYQLRFGLNQTCSIRDAM